VRKRNGEVRGASP